MSDSIDALERVEEIKMATPSLQDPRELGNIPDEPEHGRWWGRQFCPHPGQPCIDGCYFCGRDVGSITGDHDHTQVRVGGEIEYSCVCPNC